MAGRPSDEDLLRLEKQFWKALKEKNAQAAMRLSDESCIVTGPQGVGRIDRLSLGAMVERQGYTLRDFRLEDLQLSWQGDDVVTLAYTVHEEIDLDGQPISLEAFDTSTWVRRDGRFVCAVHTEAPQGDPFGRDRLPATGAHPQALAGGRARTEFVLTRLFDAPPAVVFEAWSKPEHLANWWPPQSFSLPECRMEFRSGGAFRQCMRSPDGRDYWSHGTYQEVVAPDLIIFTTALEDEPGHLVLTEVTFAGQEGQTKLTVRESFDDTPMTRFALAGLSDSFDQLDRYLAEKGDELAEDAASEEAASEHGQPTAAAACPASRDLEVILDPGKPTIVTRRAVDATRDLVFEAFTRPEYLKRWLGPRELPMTTCEVDLRPGGAYRYVHTAPDGREYGFHGGYREVVRPNRLVRTFVIESMPEHEALETLLLEESGGRTTVTTITVHKSLAARDAHLAGGRMAEGMANGYERLDALIASLQSGPSPEATV